MNFNFNNKLSEIYTTNNQHTEKEWLRFVKEFEDKHYLIPINHDFIENFVHPLLEKELIIDNQNTYFRARINDIMPYKEFGDDDLGTPRPELVNSGRFNPKGIPFLYTAKSKEVAIAEVRPYLGAKVGIAICKPLKPLKIVNLIQENTDRGINDFRKLLSRLLSAPVKPGSAELEYRPTQFIAEYFKVKGFDGVKYCSAVKPGGENVCLFDSKVMSINYREEIKIRSVNVVF